MKNKILNIISILLVIIIVYTGYNIIEYHRDNNSNSVLYNELEDIKEVMYQEKTAIKEINTPKDTSNTLYDINEDYKLWLKVDGSIINYPVVQKDNEFYLTHNFMKEESKHGAIFIDSRCKLNDKILLFHGHNMKDNTMFGSLDYFKDEEYIDEHREIEIQWLNDTETYEIFATASVNINDENHFKYYTLPHTLDGLKKYIKNLIDSSIYYNDVSSRLNEDTRMIILSTCEGIRNNKRFIVLAIKK